MTDSNFLPIIVINLLRDTHKKNKIKTLLQSLELDYSFFVAIDGNDLSTKQIEEACDRKTTIKNRKRELSPGEIGCALSHIGVYKKMLIENIQTAIVLEDDAIITKDFVKIIYQLNKFPSDWELILLGHIRRNYDCYLKYSVLAGHTIAKSMVKLMGAHSYIINQQGAKRLLNITKKIVNPIDHYTGDKNCINVYAFFPVVTLTDKRLISSIEENREKTSHSKSDFSNIIKVKKIIQKHSYIIRKLSQFIRWQKHKRSRKLECWLRIIFYKIKLKKN